MTFEEMTLKLVREITHHIEAFSLLPTKLRCVGISTNAVGPRLFKISVFIGCSYAALPLCAPLCVLTM